MRTVGIHRAQPIGDQVIVPTTICIEDALPVGWPESLDLMDRDAAELASVLTRTLPGGTLDRLVGKLLQHTASSFQIASNPRPHLR